MKSDLLLIQSSKAPTVEFDPEATAAYIRFSNAKFYKTLERSADDLIITVDVDKSGSVIGVEVIGFREIVLHKILALAQIKAPNVDFSRTTFRTTCSNREMVTA
jgi:uncharacterized protein YuzE